MFGSSAVKKMNCNLHTLDLVAFINSTQLFILFLQNKVTGEDPKSFKSNCRGSESSKMDTQ